MQIYFVVAADYVRIRGKGQMIVRMRDGGCADRIRAKGRRHVEMDCAHGIRVAD